MKYIVILVDGMADYPIASLGNKTPLEVAHIPYINALAENGEIGMVQTIPIHMSPGSDVANLSVMGYAPDIYHTGRSPLEAASIGVSLSSTDVTFRCNLVTLSEDEPYENKIMIDHSSGEITTEESKTLIEFIQKQMETSFLKLYTGVSYRHLMVWDNGPFEFTLTPPHDILGKPIAEYMPKGSPNDIFVRLSKLSYALLKDHPINRARKERGINPANSIWLWGEGKKPNLSSFSEKYHLSGSVISAVDLINGIGILAGLKPIHVEGATGTILSNFIGKAEATINALLSGDDFIYVHLEAPDECSHQGDLNGKIKSIEIIDEIVIGTIYNALKEAREPFKMLILPDHRTPISLRTHSSEPVPYVIYNSQKESFNNENQFTEIAASNSKQVFAAGHQLLDYFLNPNAS